MRSALTQDLPPARDYQMLYRPELALDTSLIVILKVVRRSESTYS